MIQPQSIIVPGFWCWPQKHGRVTEGWSLPLKKFEGSVYKSYENSIRLGFCCKPLSMLYRGQARSRWQWLDHHEAECASWSSAVSEAIWLSGVMEDLQLKRSSDLVVLFEDNQGAIGMAKNCESKRSNHKDIKHHFIRDYIANGRVAV